jgi:hypothetical protein
MQAVLPLPMPKPDPPAILRHQVLADPTGRRRRRLAIVGRVATTALGLWLVVLILGGLGLQPLAGLPIVGHLGAREAAPPALPERVQAAVARGATVAPTARAVQAPVTTVPVRSRRPALTAPSRAKKRQPARTTPATAPGHAKTTLASPAPAPSRPTTSPSTTAPGQTRVPPGQTKTGTSPSSTAPGQTKTGTGPPTTTPGTTPGANGKAHGAKGTVTTP